MTDTLLNAALLILPPAAALEFLVLFYLWLRKRRKVQPKTGRTPPASLADSDPHDTQEDLEVDDMIRELDEVSQKVLGESVVNKEQ